MKFIKNNTGFTLVEVMVAFAILAIMIFAIINIFNLSYSGIFRAGRKSEALFYAQENMDNSIAGGIESGSELTTHVIVFGGESITVTGEEKEIDYNYEGFPGTLKYFLPSGN
jgi:prepilin-type N-terminal cleavage/methylation domain-containing protein